jgi:hypothetical protein
MKRQRARLTGVERAVLRLQTDGREFSPETMRKAKAQAGEDLDAAIERDAMRAEIRARLYGDPTKEE